MGHHVTSMHQAVTYEVFSWESAYHICSEKQYPCFEVVCLACLRPSLLTDTECTELNTHNGCLNPSCQC